MIEAFIHIVVTILLAAGMGKLLAKIRLPSILGWLIAGMLLGPHAINLLHQDYLDHQLYQNIQHILECIVGLMIGTELVWKNIRKSGTAILVTTLFQSLSTFFLVSAVFGIVFYFTNIPLYLAFVFGGIALATAPAPALSIVREFHTKGPVTDTLIPMAALDDIVGCVVFFTTIAVVAASLSAGALPPYMIAVVVLLPLLVGAMAGATAGFVLKKQRGEYATLVLIMSMILLASALGFYCNTLLPKPVLNFMLIGMAFSAVFANMIREERLKEVMNAVNPVLNASILIVIVNLGAPLDYHLILGAGVYTAVYILARGCGKYAGAYCGARITRSDPAVRRYLGCTLLPHSGVSLVFTGIAVSVLSTSAPECAHIIQGTIAAAAVINEIIAVILAKKGFEWAGELSKSQGTVL